MNIAQRLNDIRAQVVAACARGGRSPGEVNILAVSKLQPIALIEEAYALGLRHFGENYVQELLEKRRQLMHLKEIRWHLIGHLQTNKVKQIVNEADFFHALDSKKLIAEIAKRAQRPWPVFIEVNVDLEPSKAGVSPKDLAELVQAVQAEPKLQLEGFMCIPEARTPVEMMRPAFRRLAELAQSTPHEGPRCLMLSMGMSEDFAVAVEEGSSWIRVGRKLFGGRPY